MHDKVRGAVRWMVLRQKKCDVIALLTILGDVSIFTHS